jgi:hypothetical protein
MIINMMKYIQDNTDWEKTLDHVESGKDVTNQCKGATWVLKNGKMIESPAKEHHKIRWYFIPKKGVDMLDYEDHADILLAEEVIRVFERETGAMRVRCDNSINVEFFEDQAAPTKSQREVLQDITCNQQEKKIYLDRVGIERTIGKYAWEHEVPIIRSDDCLKDADEVIKKINVYKQGKK